MQGYLKKVVILHQAVTQILILAHANDGWL